MSDRQFTPALGFRALTPLYDSAVGLLTRENTWRNLLIDLIDPRPDDYILDVGCGTGSLMVGLGQREPNAALVGLDPDPNVLAIGRKKLENLGLRASWRQGFLDDDAVESLGHVTKIVSSLVLHQTPLSEKGAILTNCRKVVGDNGSLFVADYGEQRSKMMRTLFRLTVQNLDGINDTQPNADGCLPELIKSAGFCYAEEHCVIQTVTGSLSLYKASTG